MDSANPFSQAKAVPEVSRVGQETPPEEVALQQSFTARPWATLAVAENGDLLAAKDPEPVAKPKRTSRSFLLPVGVFLLLILVGAYAFAFLLVHLREVDAQAEAEAAYQKRRAELKAEAEAADQRLQDLDKRVFLVALGFREVVRKATPLVVNVANYRQPQPKGGAFPRRPLVFDPEKEKHFTQSGVGSGILVKPGYVLTNYHVVKQADRLRVTFASGQSLGLDPDRVAADPLTDLAVIRLPENLPAGIRADANQTAAWADSDKEVHVGDWALAIGSPLGLRMTVTQGVISAKGRLLAMLDTVDLLQTDAAINPGNSGGPLFDLLGRVAGINVAIASDNGQSQGIGFAIPSNVARKIFDELVAKGEVVRGYLGVGLDELPAKQAQALGLAGGGARITQVLAGEAAGRAGMQPGDIIVRYNTAALAKNLPARHLRQMIFETAPETAVPVEIRRGGQRLTLTAKIGKRPLKLPEE